MQPRIEIRRKWSDDDVLLLTIQVRDGTSLFVNEAYVSRAWGSDAAEALRTFGRHVYGGIFDLQAGTEGPEYASGAFRARFHYHAPNHLLISTTQQGDHFPFKNFQVATEARMFLRTEPALLDRFVSALPALDRNDGADAALECVPLRGQ